MRRILVATDGSVNSLNATAYVADLYRGVPDLEVTLLSIYPAVPPLYREKDLDPAVRRQFENWLEKREGDTRKHIEEAAGVLTRGGLKKEQIRSQPNPQVVGVARDIIREADAGRHDALVIGKKGMSWFDDFFLGSITSKLLEMSENHPLWVVEGKGFPSRRVFIAMDEAENTLNLARYVGAKLQGLSGVEILLYHFCCPFAETMTPEERKMIRGLEKKIVEREKEDIFQCYEEAQKILLDQGFPKKSIRGSFDYDASAPPQKAAQAVLRELRNKKYGTLVVGRKGATHAREFRVGSVALRAVAEAQNCAVWVV